ncbi:type I-C CRISPR-associated protein Cas5c [Ferrimonas lipolytica]|uniref:pre-crRNA processing endonuclease n=1 Tax=Ferrimonas lipolytica TaxID=2724191 RepID=A0A6H1U9R0_9GAMM|nr:type I-C CRISPR-associated protein Cas5c [Ferrimonas lipolytica]QIZ75781.1 type I-C CRISPR-associated protein Cas5 [Ferrimonas lipolytica]
MGFCIEVRGDFACFTRPEMKVERVSYDVITPSAARSLFEAILWKPAIEWRIRKIEVLNPIRWFNLRRNELGTVIPMGSVKTAQNKGRGNLAAYIEEDRQQRASLLLRDVAYRIHADFVLTERAGPHDNAGKFAEMFRRRAAKGQCVNQPYLGTREFACEFRLVESEQQLEQPIAENMNLGWMLFDLDFSEPTNPMPLFFNAQMQQGVIEVPLRSSEEVRG